MLSDKMPTLTIATKDPVTAPRDLEFSEALARYRASYVAEHRRRLMHQQMEGHLLQKLIAFFQLRSASRDRQIRTALAAGHDLDSDNYIDG